MSPKNNKFWFIRGRTDKRKGPNKMMTDKKKIIIYSIKTLIIIKSKFNFQKRK